jgi:hypothetical protein
MVCGDMGSQIFSKIPIELGNVEGYFCWDWWPRRIMEDGVIWNKYRLGKSNISRKGNYGLENEFCSKGESLFKPYVP